MMTKNKKRNKKIKETQHSSLIVRWVSIVSLTIMVSFLIFSMVIYSTVNQQSMKQQESVSNRVVATLNSSLVSIPKELQISNVIPALSPSTQRILNGGPTINHDSSSNSSAFSDALISSISNPDISVAVYNLHNEVVFANGEDTPKLHKFKGSSWQKVIRRNNKSTLITSQKIVSTKTGKVTGYIVVSNKMTYYNHLMNNLLHRMIIISLVAIVLFSGIAFFIVRDVVKPIKEMVGVAQKVNDDPNSDVRIKDLNRNDELEDLVKSFNKMLDRMQRYIDQQKQFVSDVSHELRTPVAVIEGHLNMLERWGKDDPEILDESIKASLQEADRMKHLIQEMLDLTRAEQIDVQYPNAYTNVNEVLSRVVDDLALVHQDFNLQLDVDDLPANTYIQMYHGHLEQILVILIDNGIKYSTDRKQINVSAGVTQNNVRIVVQDFGEGISKDDQSKIFNRFYRVDKARTREKGGNGLGLTIAQKLVESYNGKISVESVEGQGSQFKIAFPILTPQKLDKLKKIEAEKEKTEEPKKPEGIL
ncbi:hypothetical protein C5L18_000810 [Lactobacillus amylolyticus]|nr:hypothetical protein C5L18_000810 [Lactobacillus amylolyticus]